MKRMLILATLSCAAAFSQAHAQMQTQDGAMSGRSYDDLRARCEQMTGNHRLDCLEQLRSNPRSAAAPRTTADIRAEARAAYATPADRCEFITTNRRLDCLQQYGRRG